MQLLSLDTPERVEIAAGWMCDKRNYQWLDFGNGLQALSAVHLKIMTQRDNHVIRLFTCQDGATPIGVVGLSEVNREFGTASTWVVLGEKRYSRKGHALQACSLIIKHGFDDLGLNALTVWAVDRNKPSQQIIRALGFKPMGKQRQCHRINGRLHDRIWFDLLAPEFIAYDRQ